MCIFILQTLSVEASFGKSLNKKFEAQDTLPQTIRITPFNGSYADYLIMVSSGVIKWPSKTNKRTSPYTP